MNMFTVGEYLTMDAEDCVNQGHIFKVTDLASKHGIGVGIDWLNPNTAFLRTGFLMNKRNLRPSTTTEIFLAKLMGM